MNITKVTALYEQKHILKFELKVIKIWNNLRMSK